MCEIVRDGAARGVPGFAEYWTPDAAARQERTASWFEANADAIGKALRGS
jgi:hypothetical protein